MSPSSSHNRPDLALVTSFLAALEPTARKHWQARTELSDELGALFAAGRATWSELELAPEIFAAHLARCLDPDEIDRGDAALSQLRGEDLYLACACTTQVPGSMAAFEREFRGVIDALYRRWRFPRIERDDLLQLARQKLLVGDGIGEPRLARYAGRGRLRNWLRMTASRLLIDASRRKIDAARQSASDEQLAALLVADSDPYQAVWRQRDQPRIKAAVERALRALPRGERSLLRYRFVYGLAVEEMARLRGVHRVTVSRSLARTRKRALENVRRELAEELEASASEIESILRFCNTQLDLSLERILDSHG
ncbi:MAG: sigma-70 family RNA polymerase sigma factor [Proteobacteria bacterium]|nr:sigma-70 family RNA polymerase sigma factor [Pseudomonadota bacterium]